MEGATTARSIRSGSGGAPSIVLVCASIRSGRPPFRLRTVPEPGARSRVSGEPRPARQLIGRPHGTDQTAKRQANQLVPKTPTGQSPTAHRAKTRNPGLYEKSGSGFPPPEAIGDPKAGDFQNPDRVPRRRRASEAASAPACAAGFSEARERLLSGRYRRQPRRQPATCGWTPFSTPVSFAKYSTGRRCAEADGPRPPGPGRGRRGGGWSLLIRVLCSAPSIPPPPRCEREADAAR